MATATKVAAPLELTTSGGPDARPFITIDEARYDLAVPGDFGIAAQAKMQRLVAQWDAFSSGDDAELTDEQADRLEAGVHWAASMLVLGCPAEVLEKLNDEQRIAIITAFSETVVAKQAATTVKTASKRKS